MIFHHSLSENDNLSSFDLIKLSEEVQNELTRQPTADATEDRPNSGRKPKGEVTNQDLISTPSTNDPEENMQSENLNLSKAIRKAQAKRQRKAERKAQWEALLKSRPDEKYINPTVI